MNKGKIISLTFLLVVVVAAIFNQKANEKELAKRKKVLVGYVYDYSPGNIKSPGGIFWFFFYYSGKRINSVSKPYSGKRGLTKTVFINRAFPVIVDSENVANNDILMTQRRFERYGMSFPDSLQWTAEYIE